MLSANHQTLFEGTYSPYGPSEPQIHAYHIDTMGSVGTNQSSLAIGFIFPILGGTCVALRFYTRWLHKNDKRIDDWLTIPAWVSF